MLFLQLWLSLISSFQASDTRFDIERLQLELSPARQILILSGDQEGLTFQLAYTGAIDNTMRFRASLAGPGQTVPQEIDVVAWGHEIWLDKSLFAVEGDYQLINVRLEKNGQIVEYAQPRTATIQVLDDLLVSRVQVRELDKAELERLGYIFNENDYRTIEFSLTLVVGAEPIQVTVPVAFPNNLVRPMEPVVIRDPFDPPIVVLPMFQNTTWGEKGGSGSGEADEKPLLYSLILIPGNFSYLKTHFNVTCITANATPEGFDISLGRMQARLKLPYAGVYGEPLSFNGQSKIKDVVFPGPDGIYTTEDDRNTLFPGEEGRVEYIITGEIEGLYDVEVEVTGEADLPAEKIRIKSVGKGRVLVRSPEYRVDLEHPDAVAVDEPYDFTMTFTNTGNTSLEDLSVALEPQMMLGVDLEAGESPTRAVGTLGPGEERALTWRLRSLVAGRVYASYFKLPGNIPGQLSLQIGIGENQERITGAVIALPQQFFEVFPPLLTAQLKKYAKKLFDFSSMTEQTLPVGLKRPGYTFDLFQSFGMAAKSQEWGLGYRESCLRLFSSWLRSGGEDERNTIDPIRRHILGEGNMFLEEQFGALLAEAYLDSDTRTLLEDLAWDNENATNMLAVIVESSDPVSIEVLDSSGQITHSDGRRQVPYSSIVPLDGQRSLVWASGFEETPRLKITGSGIKVDAIFRGAGVSQAFWELQLEKDSQFKLQYNSESKNLLVSPGSSAPHFFSGESLVEKPFQLLSVRQLGPAAHEGADSYGRSILFTFSRCIDLQSLVPLEEHLTIAGSPISRGVVQTDGRFLMVGSNVPVGPYVPFSYEIKGARDFMGNDLGLLSGQVMADQSLIGVTASGRVVDHAGSDISKARARVLVPRIQNSYSSFSDEENPEENYQRLAGQVLLEEKTLNANGEFSFDFIPYTFEPGPLNFNHFKIAVILEDGRYRVQDWSPLAPGQHIQSDFAFNSLGSVQGRVLFDNQPVPFAPIFLANQKDLEHGVLARADEQGLFRIDDVEVGPILVKSQTDQFVGAGTGYLTWHNSPLTVDVNINKVHGSVGGRILYLDEDGKIFPIEDAFVGFIMHDTWSTSTELSGVGIEYTVGTRTDANGSWHLDHIPSGFGHFLVYHPRFGGAKREIFIGEGENQEILHYYDKRDFQGGSARGVVMDEDGNLLTNATVTAPGLSVKTDENGSFYLDRLSMGRYFAISARHGDNSGGIRLILTREQPDVDNVQIVVKPIYWACGTLTTFSGDPIPEVDIWAYENDDLDLGEEVATTDMDGNWCISGQEGIFTLAAVIPPGLAYRKNVYINRYTEEIHLVQKPKLTLGVQLKDTADRWVVGHVTLGSKVGSSYPEFPGFPIDDIRKRFTEIDNTSYPGENIGHLTIPRINADEITISGSSLILGETAALNFTLTEDMDLELVFPHDDLGQIFGQVMDSDGKTVAPPGTIVQATMTNGVVASTEVDENGIYWFDSLISAQEMQNVTLTFFNEERQLFRQDFIQSNQHIRMRHDVVLSSFGNVSVRVEYSDGTPADFAGVALSATSLEFYDQPNSAFRGLNINRAIRSGQVTPEVPALLFENVPAGEFTVKALAGSGLVGMRTYGIPQSGGDLEVVVRLEAASSIGGQFVNHNNEPIGDAAIELWTSVARRLIQKQLSSNDPPDVGNFLFEDLPMRTYDILGTDPLTNLTANARVATTPFAPHQNITLTLDPVVTLTGSVFFEAADCPVAGEPCPQAGVNLSLQGRKGQTIYTATDSNGVYRLDNIPVGSYTLEATKRGIPGAALQSILVEEEPNPYVVDLYFSKIRDVDILVLDPDGEPITYALVNIYGPKFTSGFTDGTGHVSFERMPEGVYGVKTKHPLSGIERAMAFGISAADPDRVEETIYFRGTGSVQGKVLSSNGEPLNEPVQVTVSNTSDPLSKIDKNDEPKSETDITVHTTADGHYYLYYVPIGERVFLMAQHPRTGEYVVQPIELSQHGEVLEVDMVLRAATKVSGMVSYVDGTPAEQAIVSISDPYQREVYTDANGHFELYPVPEGDILFTASELRSQRSTERILTVAQDDQGNLPEITDFQLSFKGLGRGTGYIRYSDGKPVNAGIVTAYNTFGQKVTAVPIFANGSFRLPLLPAGSVDEPKAYDLIAYDNRYARFSDPVRLEFTRDNQELTTEITFEPSYILHGYATSDQGTLLKNVQIEVFGIAEFNRPRLLYATQTDTNGHYFIEHIYPGNYDIYAVSEFAQWRLYEEAFLMTTVDTQHDLALRNTSWVVGTVVDQSGNILSGNLTLFQKGNTYKTRVAADGTFSFLGLTPDPVRITASLANGWVQLDKVVVLTPGNNFMPLAADQDTITLEGRAYALSAQPVQLFANLTVKGIRTRIRPAEDGKFYVSGVPRGEEVFLELGYSGAHQVTPLGSFDVDSDVGTITLDITPPEATFEQENAQVTGLPFSLSMLVSDEEVGIDPARSMIWINDYPVTTDFQLSLTEFNLEVNQWSYYYQRGTNQLKLDLVNTLGKSQTYRWTFDINYEGTNLLVDLKHNDQPIAGSIFWNNTWYPSNGSGRVSLDHVPTGAQTLKARAEDLGGRKQFQVNTNKLTQEVSFSLNPYGTYIGRITNSDGQPLTDQVLQIDTFSEVSDSNGDFVFDYMPINPFYAPILEASFSNEYGRLVLPRLVVPNQISVANNLQLQGRGTVTGFITDSGNGLPVSAAEITLTYSYDRFGDYRIVAQTDTNGFYQIEEVLTYPFSIRAQKGSNSTSANAQLSIKNSVLDLNLVLQPATVLSGSFVGPDGQPAAGAAVSVGYVGGSIFYQGLLDEAGLLHLDYLPPNAALTLMIADWEQGHFYRQTLSLPAGIQTDLGSVELLANQDPVIVSLEVPLEVDPDFGLRYSFNVQDDFALDQVVFEIGGAYPRRNVWRGENRNNYSQASYLLLSASMPEGPVDYLLTVTDTFGRVTTLGGTIAVVENTQAPEVTILQPTPASEAVEGQTFQVIADLFDQSGLKKAELRLGNQLLASRSYPINQTSSRLTLDVLAPDVFSDSDVPLTLAVYDFEGYVTYKDLSIHVLATTTSGAPTVHLISPIDNMPQPLFLEQGLQIPLAASMTDPDGLGVAIWYVDGNEVARHYLFGTEDSIDDSVVLPGIYRAENGIQITLETYDLGGNPTQNQVYLPAMEGTVQATDLVLANWNTSLDGQSLILVGGTHIIDGAHQFEDLVLVNGAHLTQTETANDNAIIAWSDLEVTHRVVINYDSNIAVDGTGFHDQPPGISNGSYGSHAGLSAYSQARVDHIYGSPLQPRLPGSTDGGGAVKISATDFWLAGLVTALPQGSGSGGSIHLEAQHFYGEGLVLANGFEGLPENGNTQWDKGSGGRIAIYGDFAGKVEAYGNRKAGSGTIYTRIPDVTQPDGFRDQILIKGHADIGTIGKTMLPVLRNLVMGVNATLETINGQDVLTLLDPYDLTPGRYLGMHLARPGELASSGEVFDQEFNVLKSKPGESFGPIEVGESFDIDFLVDEIVLADGAVLDLNGQIPVSPIRLEGGILYSQQPVDLSDVAVVLNHGGFDGDFQFGENLELLAGTWIVNGTLRAGNITLASDAVLSTPIGKENQSITLVGDNLLINGQVLSQATGQIGVNGSHGGTSPGDPITASRGSFYRPMSHGSYSYAGNQGGGGYLNLIFDRLELNGVISVNPGVHGGSGSILLEGNQLLGVGLLDASGLSPELSYPRGGGRIGILVDDMTQFTGLTRAFGGEGFSTSSGGGAGTVFYQTSEFPHGKLVVDNIGILTNPDSTPLPGLGIRTAGAPTGGGPIIEGANFPDNLTGLYVVVEGFSPVRISNNTSTQLFTADPVGFPPIGAGQSYSGLHQLDVLEVLGAANLCSIDPINIFGTYDIRDGSTIGHTVLNTSGGVRELTDGVFTVNDPNISSLILNNAQVTLEIPLNLQQLVMSNGSTLSHAVPFYADSITIDNSHVISSVRGPAVSAGSIEMTNHASWTPGNKPVVDAVFPLTIQTTGHFSLDGTSIIDNGSSSNIINHNPPPWGSGWTSNIHAGVHRLETITYPERPAAGSFAWPVWSGPQQSSPIHIIADSLLVDGHILGDGCTQGGAGGSVLIEANTLSGVGTLSVKANSGYGGGRIAIHHGGNLDFLQTLDIQTSLDYDFSLLQSFTGAGTLYLKGPQQQYGELIVDQDLQDQSISTRTEAEGRHHLTTVAGPAWLTTNTLDNDPDPRILQDLSWTALTPGLAGLQARFTLDSVTYELPIIDNTHNSITFGSDAPALIPAGTQIELLLKLDRLVLRNGGQLFFPGLVETPELVLEGEQLNSIHCRDLILPGPDFNLNDHRFRLILDLPQWENKNLNLTNAQLWLDRPITVQDINLVNSQITHTKVHDYYYLLQGLISIQANNITADATSGFDVSNRANMSAPNGSGTQNHGGLGSTTGNPVFGSMFKPDTYGPGSSSGGQIRITAQSINGGFFRANSLNKTGGSVFLKANVFTGVIEASANGSNISSSAGGGRVALYGDLGNANLTVEARSPTGVAPGTVFLKDTTQNHGSLILDNGPNPATRATPLPTFSPQTFGAGFSVSYNQASQYSQILIPDLAIEATYQYRTYTQNYEGYYFIVNDDQEQTFRIVSSVQSGPDALFTVEGDLSALANGDQLGLALWLDQLSLGIGCSLDTTNLRVLDPVDPSINQVTISSWQGGPVLSGEPFFIEIQASDNVILELVSINFQGHSQSLTSPPYRFEELAPVVTEDSLYQLTITLLDASGRSFSQDQSFMVQRLSPPTYDLSLVDNGGFELPLQESAWIQTTSNWNRVTTNPLPYEGSYSLNTTQYSPGEVYQDIYLSSWANQIDAGTQSFVFTGWTGGFGNKDLIHLILEYRDHRGLVLDNFDTGQVDSPEGWTRWQDIRFVPAGTRVARIRLAPGTGSLDGFYDDLRLMANPPISMAQDLEITSVEAPASAQIYESIPLTVHIRNLGTDPADVTLQVTNTTSGQLFEISSTGLAPGDRITLTQQIPMVDTGLGVQELHINLSPLPQETNLGNNSDSVQIAVTSPTPTFQQNLILNPGAETPVPDTNWQATSGTWQQLDSSPYPTDGSWFFRGSSAAEVELYQDIQVSAYQETISQGSQFFEFEGWSRRYASSDRPRMVVEYRNQSSQVLDSYDTGLLSASGWQLSSDLRLAPPGTRTIRVRLLGSRSGSSSCEVYFDQLSLTALGVPGMPKPTSWWTFDLADRNSGKPMDITGRNPSIQSGATEAASPYRGQASSFGTADQRVEIDGHEGLDATQQLTLSTWARVDSFVADGGLITYGDATTESFALITSSDGTLAFRAGNETLIGGSIPTDEWHHLAVTFNLGQVMFFIDGQISQTATWSQTSLPPAGEARLLTLGYHPSTGAAFAGSLDETALWHQALTLFRINELYQAFVADNLPDFRPPEDVSGLSASSTTNQLDFTWTGSVNSQADLMAYNLYVDGVKTAELDASQQSWSLETLAPKTAKTLRVTAVDSHFNESVGQSLPAITQTDQPRTFPQPVAFYSLDDADLQNGLPQDAQGRHHASQAEMSSGHNGINGQAAGFDGLTNQITIPAAPGLDLSQHMTLALWIYAETFDQGAGLVSYSGTTWDAFALTLDNDNGQYARFTLGDPTSLDFVRTNTSLYGNGMVSQEMKTANWHHLAVTFDAGLASIYLDGQLQESLNLGQTSIPLPTDRRLTLGQHGRTGASYAGQLDEVLLWDQVLDSQSLALLYQNQRNLALEDLRPPARVSELVATPATNEISLNWTAPLDSDLAHYLVLLDGSSTGTVNAPETSFLAAGLEPQTTYEFSLISLDHQGNQSPATTISATTQEAGNSSVATPVAFYTFTTADKVNALVGDVAGHNHAIGGTSTTGTSFGKVGEGIYLNGSTSGGSGFVEFPSKTTPDFDSQFTLTGWVRIRGSRNQGYILGQSSTAEEKWSLVTQTNNSLTFKAGGNSLSSTTQLPTGSSASHYYHLAVTFDAGVVKLFLNGVLENSATWSMTSLDQVPESFLTLGASPRGGERFYGDLDEIMLWDQALNGSAVAMVYQQGVNLLSCDQAPLDLRPAKEVTNPTVSATGSNVNIGWTHSPSADLANYLIYLNDNPAPVFVGANLNNWVLQDQAALSLNKIWIKTLDQMGNQSEGVQVTGVTLPSSDADLTRAQAYWSMDTADALNSKPQDVTGRHPMFYVSGGQNNGTSLIGQSQYHNGSSLFGEVRDAEPLRGGQNLSVSGWFRISSFTNNAGILYYGSDTEQGYLLATYNDDGEYLGFSAGGLTATDRLRTPVLKSILYPGGTKWDLNTSQWYHLAVTFDQGEAILYLNGQEVDHKIWPLTALPTPADAYLAFGRNPLANKYNGYSDEVVLYNQTLDATQIALLYQVGRNAISLHHSPFNFKPAEDVTNLAVSPQSNALNLSWTGSLNSRGDLVAYRLYVDDAAPLVISAALTSYNLPGLQPKTSYQLKLTTLDQAGNESPGVNLTAITLPQNSSQITRPVAYYSMDYPGDMNASLMKDVTRKHDAFYGYLSSNQTTTNTIAGQAVRFSGSSHSNEILADQDFEGSQLSLSLWIKPTSFTDNGGLIYYGNDQSSSNLRFGLNSKTTNGKAIEFRSGTTPNGMALSTPAFTNKYNQVEDELNLNQWYHLAVSYDGIEAILYLDGREVDRKTWGAGALPDVLNSFLAIGLNPVTNLHYYGYLDELVIFDQAISQEEILLLTQAGRAGQTLHLEPFNFRPAEEITNLNVSAQASQLSFNWTPPIDADGDLTHYLVEIDGGQPEFVSKNQTSFALTNLEPLSRHEFRIYTVDLAGNQSPGVSLAAVTLPDPLSSMPRPVSYWSMDTSDLQSSKPVDLMGRNPVISGYATIDQRISNGAAVAGEAIRISSSSHFLDIMGNPSLNASDQLTLSLWVRVSNFYDNGGLLSYGGTDPNAAVPEAWSLTTWDETGKYLTFQMAGVAPADVLQSEKMVLRHNVIYKEMNTSDFYFVGIVFDQGTARFYLNGVLQDEKTWPLTSIPSLNDALLRFGKHTDGTGNTGYAYMDEVVIWDQALSQEALTLIWQTGRSHQTLKSGNVDFQIAGEVTNLVAQPTADGFILDWVEPSDTESVLIYLDDNLTPAATIGASILTASFSQLNPDQTYQVRLATVDSFGNQSPGIEVTLATIPPAGMTQPVSYWTMDQTSYPLLDELGGNHSSTAIVSLNQTTAPVGVATRFNSTSHHITIDADPSLDLTSELSFSAWIKPSTFYNEGGIVTYGSDNQESWSLMLMTSDTGGTVQTLRFRVGGDNGQVVDFPVVRALNGTLVSQMPKDLWSQVTLTFNQGLARLFLNGSLISAATLTTSNLTLPENRSLVLGRNHVGTVTSYSGYMDEVAIWNSALSPAEISNLYWLGVRGQTLWSAPSTKTLFTAAGSYEDQSSIVLDGENLQVDHLATDKELWLYNSTLTLTHSLRAREIHLLEGSVINQPYAQDQALVITTQTIEIDSSSSLNVDGRGFNPWPNRAEVLSPLFPVLAGEGEGAGGAIHLQAHQLRLDGGISARGLGQGDGGSILIETDLFYGEGSLDVRADELARAPGASGNLALHIGNLPDFKGQILAQPVGDRLNGEEGLAPVNHGSTVLPGQTPPALVWVSYHFPTDQQKQFRLQFPDHSDLELKFEALYPYGMKLHLDTQLPESSLKGYQLKLGDQVIPFEYVQQEAPGRLSMMVFGFFDAQSVPILQLHPQP